ncbi:MAG: mandelate racemase/muconate lactonizing enzyme family protein [Alphaproteobacteria bacterium]|nr:mandelate racemase/muconate lactonizing enzyme family protein [Alphaproteobacteria bacterium]
MKITDIKTFLMQAGSPPNSGAWAANFDTIATGWRNWLFVKVYTDEGITGIGECSGWPRVIETAVADLKSILIGEDPRHIERLWQKMQVAIMGHGISGVVGAGAMTGIDMALWDIKGKALNTPVWNLLGGKLRDKVRIYAHASTPEVALQLKAEGVTAIKAGGLKDPVRMLEGLRAAIGDEMDLMVDLHGPPWLTTADAIALGRRLEPLGLMFMEDPVAPEQTDAYARIRDAVAIPLAAGERLATIWGLRPLIERDLVDVVQPDTGRAGGITQMKKIAAMAEAHGIMFAPHSGSLGPVAEYAALHLLAAIPNALMLERVEIDWAGRSEVITPVPRTVDGFITVPDSPGLGVDIDEAAVAKYPSARNVGLGKGDYAAGTADEYVYVQSRLGRRRWLAGE